MNKNNNQNWEFFNDFKIESGSQSSVQIFDNAIVIKKTPKDEMPRRDVIEKLRAQKFLLFKCLIPLKVEDLGVYMLSTYIKATKIHKYDSVVLCKSLKYLHNMGFAYWDLFPDNVINGNLIDNGLISEIEVKPHKLRKELMEFKSGLEADLYCLGKYFKVDMGQIEDKIPCECMSYSLGYFVASLPLLMLLLSIFMLVTQDTPWLGIGIIFGSLFIFMCLLFLSYRSSKGLNKRHLKSIFWESMILHYLTPVHIMLELTTSENWFFNGEYVENILGLYKLL